MRRPQEHCQFESFLCQDKLHREQCKDTFSTPLKLTNCHVNNYFFSSPNLWKSMETELMQ